MMRSILVVCLLAVTAFAVSVSFARADEHDFVSSRGEGFYKLGGDRESIQRMSIRFRSEHRYVIKMQLESGREVEFTGRYTGEGYHREADLRHGLGADDIEGNGEMWIADNNGKLQKFKARGEVRGQSFRIEFESNRYADQNNSNNNNGNSGPGWDSGNNEFSFADSLDGSGHVEYSGERHRLTHLRVKMSRNGDLQLRFEGPDMPDEVWEGRWWGTGPNYSVDIRNHATYAVHASGILTLSNNNRRFKEISVNGRSHGESFSLDFKAERDNDGGRR